MRKKYIFGKKLYISVLTSILVLLTTVATTFAWVGVFANSTFESFDVSIKGSFLGEYGVVISATGEEGTFSETIDALTVKKMILKNWGYSSEKIEDDEKAEALFNSLNMHQCTTLPILDGNKIKKLGTFKTIEKMITKNYFKFDIYVAPIQLYPGSTSDYLLDLYVSDNLITSTPRNYIPTHSVTFPNSFSNPLINLPDGITIINGGSKLKNIRHNPSKACRVAFEKYSVVDKGSPEQYTSLDEPISTVIYSTDSYNYPIYDSNSTTYNFGGILPNDANFGILNYNQSDYIYAKNGIKYLSMDEDIYSIRGVTGSHPDIVLSSETNHLINPTNANEQISLEKMMKISISFWIEGWDADCINTLNQNLLTLSVELNTTNEEKF